jgi:hypothetical protein
VDVVYQRLLDSIYDEIHARVPHQPRTFQRTCAVLISSPGAQVYYHFDTSGQTLWQIHGTKKLWLYPRAAPFLTQERIDMVTAFRESFHDEATQPYRPWMDSYAIDFRGDGDRKLYPDDMVYWPLKRQRPLKLTMPTLTVQGPVGFPNAYKLCPHAFGGAGRVTVLARDNGRRRRSRKRLATSAACSGNRGDSPQNAASSPRGHA